MSSSVEFDIAIIGGGIVGASIAYHLAGHARVLMLEAEVAPGYHSTGRSAALYAPSYGPPAIRALTRASQTFFDQPPAGFAAAPLLKPRGALFIASQAQLAQARAFYEAQRAECDDIMWLDGPAVRARVPVLNPEAAVAGIFDPRADDIEVDLLLQGFLRGAREQGLQLMKNARVCGLARESGQWRIRCDNGQQYLAAKVVNAAGAWADELAALAGIDGIGIEPRRRSAFLFPAPEGVDTSDWPLVLPVDESWYFKPDAGVLLGSPANADPVPPHDVVPEDLDIATAIHYIEASTSLRIHRPSHSWAGLRSFVADGEPVCGFDPATLGFFWAAALGGYGIQSAPATGRLAAALILGGDIPPDIAGEGLTLAAIAPGRAGIGATA